MKQFLHFFTSLLFLCCTVGYAQDTDDHSGLSTISLAVAMPPEIKGLTDAQMSMLEDRIKNVVSMNGLSAEGGLEGFLIYPKFDVNSMQTITQPLGNLTIARCSFSLFVRQYIPNSVSNIVFSSYSREIAGSGSSETDAIANAVTQIRPDDEAFQGFLNKARARIIGYYVQNCERIMNEAQHAADLQNYDKAFALLLSIPKEASQCYGQVQQRAVDIYQKKQRQECNRHILEARTFAAAHNYDSALATIRKIDPESVCKDDLFTLVNDIVSRVDENEKKSWDLLIEQLRDKAELDKARVAAEAQMASAYLEGVGRRSYIVNGSGPNATVQVDQSSSGNPGGQFPNAGNPGGQLPAAAPAKTPSTSAAPDGILATTQLTPNIFFENNIFPSFIISRSGYAITEDMKKYGDIYSCIGMNLTNPSMSGAISYEIEPIENKYFEKITGSVNLIRSQTLQYFPEIPWKYDALKNIQQSTPLSIRYRLTDNTGASREMIVKVSIRSIRECITSFLLDGKQQMSPTLAAYVNEENPQIDIMLKEGLDKKWLAAWVGYQEGAEGLSKQVKAIWKLLSEKGIHYSDITGATTSNGASFASQTVRPFCESIANKQANCVEGTLLFASILKKIDLRPVLVIVPGHCFLGFHATNDDTGDYIFLETTLLGDIKGEPTEAAFEAKYLEALKVGAHEFTEADKSKTFLIDVQLVREQHITPINLSVDACK